MKSEFLKVKEVAEYLGYGTQYIYNLVHGRKIPYYKTPSGAIRFSKMEIDEWVKSRTTTEEGGKSC